LIAALCGVLIITAQFMQMSGFIPAIG